MKKESKKPQAAEAKTKYVSQSDVPKSRIDRAIKVPLAIWDNFAGHPTSPINVAKAMDISPTSSNWQEIPGSSMAYGLTVGGYNAQQISLTDLGRRIVAPKEENDDKKAIIEAIFKPRVLRDFYTKYKGAKFPKDNIAINVIIDMGVPPAKAEQVLSIIKENGKFAGILQEIKGNQYIIIDNSTIENSNPSSEESIANEADALPADLPAFLTSPKKENQHLKGEIPGGKSNFSEKAKVFISHGKNRKIVDQLKEILKFGQFDVVVSVEKESTAISVPEKVFADMRECNAAVIHIEGEEKFLDNAGTEHIRINENVLIEIGAAMALYGKRFILLCQKSLKLPSNLQGIYRCEYEGSELNYDSTIKLLKTFNEFRKIDL
jgi:predicted nucleotide-binding protein